MDHLRATHASPGFLHAVEVDAERYAAQRAADPDQGWVFTSGRRIRTRRHFHRAPDRSLPFYARALRNGRDEWATGLTEAAAIATLRRRLGLP